MNDDINGNTGFVTGEETNTNQASVNNIENASVETSSPSPQQVNNMPQENVNTVFNVNSASITQGATNIVSEPSTVAPIVTPASSAASQVEIKSEPVVMTQNTDTTPETPTLTPESVVSTDNKSTNSKQSKCKKIFIFSVIILLLTVVGVIVGVLFFNKFGVNKGKTESVAVESNSTTISSNVINNVDVDAQKLDDVLKLLGISEKNIDELTFFVTDENYQDNAKDIITYFAILGSDMTSLFENADSYKNDKGACSDTEGCAIISKANAEEILKLYNFSGELKDYFYKSEKSDDVYGIHYGSTLVLPKFDGDNLGIGHNLTAKYIGDSDIDIEDKQLFNYNDDEGQFKSVNRVAKYTFKKDTDGSYHLDNVLISE